MSTNPVTALNSEQTATAELHSLHEGYLKRNLVELDKLINVLEGGYSDETISARAARLSQIDPKTKLQAAQRDYGVLMCHFLNLFQEDHGAKAVAGDEARAEQVEQVEANSGIITPAEAAQ